MVRSDLEDVIFEIISERPVSAETVAVITSLPTNLIIMKLKKMQKWYGIEPVTKKTVMIWGKRRGKEAKAKCQGHEAERRPCAEPAL